MAYQGYLFKIGSYTLPLKYIEYKSYKAQQITQDVNSKRSTDGVLHRKTAKNKPPKCSFNLLAGLDSDTVGNILKHIQDNYTIPDQKAGNCTVFVPEINGYKTVQMYLDSEVEFTIEEVDNAKNLVYYDTITLTFVGY